MKQAKVWSKRDLQFWTKEIHGYIDNKKFAVPVSAKKKAMILRQKITGHLRTPGEGVSPECVKPKTKHTFIGVPMVEYTACVSPSKGKIIMMHEVVKDIPGSKKWNGLYAQRMYEGPLAKALKDTYGKKKSYRIVEDGDPSGYQCEDGKAGKRAGKIRSWRLPPRTPDWNPLDFSIWKEIEDVALSKVKVKATKKEYAKIVHKVAMNLSTTYLKDTCAKVGKKIKETIEAKGQHIKND